MMWSCNEHICDEGGSSFLSSCLKLYFVYLCVGYKPSMTAKHVALKNVLIFLYCHLITTKSNYEEIGDLEEK